MDALSANIVACAAAAAPVLRQRKHFEISHPEGAKQSFLGVISCFCFTIIALNRDEDYMVYVAAALAITLCTISLAPTRVTDEMAVRFDLGPSSYLEDCRAGYKTLQQVSVFRIGDYTSMFLRSAPENTFKKQESLATFGLRPLALGEVKMSHLGGVSKPLFIADSNIGTHIIIGIEHSTVRELVDAVLASRNQAQQAGEKGQFSWISYNFVDTTRDCKKRGSIDSQMDDVCFNACAALDSLDFEAKLEADELV